MSKALSVKMDEGVFRDADRLAKRAHISRNAYINKAVKLMNRLQERQKRSEQYRVDALEARASSKEVMKEFERFLDEGL
jgi:predicted transcriptional regulator